ncbi:hypothetical protein LguiA_010376 [Lonicera macranthoides]
MNMVTERSKSVKPEELRVQENVEEERFRSQKKTARIRAPTWKRKERETGKVS